MPHHSDTTSGKVEFKKPDMDIKVETKAISNLVNEFIDDNIQLSTSNQSIDQTAKVYCDNNLFEKKVFKAVSDAKAAIRYFKQNYSIYGNNYGIDTLKIYFGGCDCNVIMRRLKRQLQAIKCWLGFYSDSEFGFEGEFGKIYEPWTASFFGLC